MTPQEARRLADGLIKAAQRAEADGRDKLNESDLDVFAAADDAARDKLAAAIAVASGQPQITIDDN